MSMILSDFVSYQTEPFRSSAVTTIGEYPRLTGSPRWQIVFSTPSSRAGSNLRSSKAIARPDGNFGRAIDVAGCRVLILPSPPAPLHAIGYTATAGAREAASLRGKH